jgi:hypothetical protein
MTLVVKNTRDLINPKNIKLKVLLYGMHGTGKSTWLSTVPDIGVGVSETGHGRGLMGVASKNIDYCEINSYDDYDAFCSGAVFKEKTAIGLDSLSDIAKTHIKAKALSFANRQGDTSRRAVGIPEMQDWGVIGELTRKLLKKLIDQDKHVLVTAGLKVDRPDENGTGETIIGPDLSGMMFLGSTAMFDIVMCTRVRQVLDDPKDAKSRRAEYYFVTSNPGTGMLAKNRMGLTGKSFLPPEVVFNPNKGEGDFNWFLNKIQTAYADYTAAPKV